MTLGHLLCASPCQELETQNLAERGSAFKAPLGQARLGQAAIINVAVLKAIKT